MGKRMSKVEKIKIRKKIANRKRLTLLACSALIFIFFLFSSFPIMAASSDNDQTLSQLEQTIANSIYSEFQKSMVLNTAQNAIEKGISPEDTLSIVKGSINNEVDAYNIKKFLDTAITAKDDGISETPLINKVKEGLAKKVDERLIINVLSQKSENMKIARDLLSKNEISNGETEEMIDILADSLANGVPESALGKVLKRSSEEGKSWEDVEIVTQELATLGLKAAELGIANDKIETIFNQALDGNSSMENICCNIQDLITAAIAAKVTSGTVSNDGITGNTGSVIPDLPSSPSGSGPIGSGPSAPSGETGSSPISSGGGNKTDNESGSSPLN